MKALAIITIIYAVLALIMGAIVYPIVKRFCKNEKAVTIVGCVAVGFTAAMALVGIINTFVDAMA